MNKILSLVLIISFVVGQTPKYDSPYLNDDVRSSIKQLIKYSEIASGIETLDTKIEFYKAVSEAIYISTNKLERVYSNKVKNNYKTINNLILSNSKISEISLPTDEKPIFSYDYKPIKITQKAKDKNIHEKQAKKMKVQYIKLYSYYKDLNQGLEIIINELEIIINELEIVNSENEVQEEPDVVTQNVENQDKIETTDVKPQEDIVESKSNSPEVETIEEVKTQSFCNLGLQLSNSNENTVQVVYDCSESIYGFQFELTNVSLISSKNPIFDIRFSERNGQILGFSLKGDSMPLGKGLLVEFSYKLPVENSEVCLLDEVIAGKGGTPIHVKKGPCLTINGSGISVSQELEVVIEEPITVEHKEVEKPNQDLIKSIEISDFKNAFRNARNSGVDTFEFDGLKYSTLTRKDFRRAFRKARIQGESTFSFGDRTYSTKIKK